MKTKSHTPFIPRTLLLFLAYLAATGCNPLLEGAGDARHGGAGEQEIHELGTGPKGLGQLIRFLLENGPQEYGPQEARKLLDKNFRIPGIPMKPVNKIIIGEKTRGKAAMVLHFDFGGRKERVFQVPEKMIWVLKTDKEPDAIPVKSSPGPIRAPISGQSIIVRNRVRFEISTTGIVSTRKGDLRTQLPFLTLNLKLRTEYAPDKVLTHNGRIVLKSDENDKPLQENGNYVPLRFDNWIIIDAVVKTVEAPLPTI